MSNCKTIPPDRKPESYDGCVRARKSAAGIRSPNERTRSKLDSLLHEEEIWPPR